MQAIGNTELARLRVDAESTMSKTCSIKRISNAADGQGGQVQTEIPVASNVKCRLSLVNKFKYQNSRFADIELFNVFTPYNTDVLIGDIVVISNKKYVVLEIKDPNILISRQLICQEVV